MEIIEVFEQPLNSFCSGDFEFCSKKRNTSINKIIIKHSVCHLKWLNKKRAFSCMDCMVLMQYNPKMAPTTKNLRHWIVCEEFYQIQLSIWFRFNSWNIKDHRKSHFSMCPCISEIKAFNFLFIVFNKNSDTIYIKNTLLKLQWWRYSIFFTIYIRWKLI